VRGKHNAFPSFDVLEINVNELLSGEKSSADEYQQKAEESMMTLVKENEYVQTYKPLIGWIVYGPDFESRKFQCLAFGWLFHSLQ
jgi:hypothetical protein